MNIVKLTKQHVVFACLLCSGLAIATPSSALSITEVQETLQQRVRVTGTVTGSDGETIIGASVQVKGQKSGTITDLNGRFIIQAPATATLVVSYIGYQTREILLNGQTTLQVKLQEDNQKLDEVVVVGYGTMRKKDLTGSVIQIKPDAVADEAPKAVADILRGTAGLKVGLSTGAKGGGSLEIRGQRSVSSLANGSPMIILDGMPFYGELSEINPNDIGQIDVLKDASSAAVYGARAANGVIIITTKKGKTGKPTITFRANFGLDTKATYARPWNASEYMHYREDWYKKDTYGLNPETNRYEAYQARSADGTLSTPNGYYERPDHLPNGVSADNWRQYQPLPLKDGESDWSLYARRLGLEDRLLENYLAGRSFDWYDYGFRTGFNQDYTASVSGAGERMNYYLSFGYSNNQSAVRGDYYHAYRVNMKLSGDVTKWLEIAANVNFQDRSDDNQTINLGSTLQNSPYASYKDEEGNLVRNPMGDMQAYLKGYNYDYEKQWTDYERGYTILNTIFTAKLKLPFNITYSFNIAPRMQFFYNRYFSSAERPETNPKDRGVDRYWGKNFDWSLNNTINWDYTFAKKHHVIVTLVQEAEEFRYWSDAIYARNIQPSDALGFHNTQNATKEESSFSTNDTHQTATGLMARGFYSFDDRYMATVTFRRDGYSAFGANNPYATFPSFGFGWSFTNEKWFHWKPLSTGKLRLSWGKNGNRSLNDPYISLPNLRNGTGLYGYLDASGNLKESQYLLIDRLASPDLKWEKSASFNVGLDFGFLDDRITGSFEAYVVKTQDMIMNKSLPNFTGFGSIATNLGEVQNTGVELTVNSKNIETKNFTWNTSFNFTYNNNKIKHLYYTYEDVTDDAGNVIGSKEKDDVANGWFIGHPVSAIWNYKVTGIWQPDELEEAKKYNQVPGDPKVANLYTADDKINADGTRTPVYNDKDKVFQGQSTSPYFWQMRNSFTFYKNFEFSFNMYSYMGGKYTETNYLNSDNGSNVVTYGANILKKEYWTPDNLTNKYGRLNARGPYGAEWAPMLHKRNFIRLENITFGYSLPQAWLKKASISRAKIYATIRNVAVWTPEKYAYGDIETYGYLNRMYTIGLNVTF